MKVSQVIDTIDTSYGGPSRSVTHLAGSMNKNFSKSVTNTIYTIDSKNPIVSNFATEIKFFKSIIANYSPSLKKALNDSRTDIFHGHGLWQLPVHHMTKVALKRKLPYVISPRGMLEPWPLSQKSALKRIALMSYQMADLNNANCVHATADIEAENLRKLGIKSSIAVIPNGIVIDDFLLNRKTLRTSNTILFLSRIHEKKGIEMLIEAWAGIDISLKESWKVRIVGDGESAYINQLRKKILTQGLQNDITIEGPIYGSEKSKIFMESDIFVLPSYSENFGIVVAEAMASKCPVITTKGAPWQDLESYRCGRWIDIGVEPLRSAMTELMSLTKNERIEMGARGRELVVNKYSMESVAEKMHHLYSYLIKDDLLPSFMFND